MAQTQNKTQPTEHDVEGFLASIDDPQKRQDCKIIADLMQEATGQPPKMWGSSIVGFGQYHYKYESGREGDFLAVGFSPRKASITIYAMCGPESPLIADLGQHTSGKGCIYIKRLSDVDTNVLRNVIKESYDYVTTHWAY